MMVAVATHFKMRLLEKLNTRTAKVGIVGLGYVGLPLAVAFAEAGFQVLGVDLSPQKVDSLNRGVSYIPDIPTEDVAPLVKNGHLKAYTSYDILREADVISVCVPTPLRKTKDPDMTYVIEATEAIAGIRHAGMLVILESTTYPGTTQEILAPRLTDGDLRLGEDIFVAFSPERIDPGNQVYTVKNTPKVVGGMTPDCKDVAMAYYGTIVDEVVGMSSPTAAEMVKLLENTFRAVNIGLVNEIALMCDKLDINVWEVIQAAATKPFGFMPFYPGPGLGGHCIPVDPHYLSWKLKTLNYTARFIELASEINTSMPYYVVSKVTDGLNDDAKSVKNAKIHVMGVAYKRDIDDVRESPALDIIQLLEEKGALVSYHDPYVPRIRLEGERIMEASAYSPAWLAEADCVVIVTDHTVFNWSELLDNSHLVVDTRNATAKFDKGSTRVIGL
jgi:UDP-N-acetyl-D-glucosamine dehydrogenase